MMGQQGPKHVGFCVLQHYNFNELYAFVGRIVKNEA
jgi:hypothetical protein